jgi:hypothetical protein
VNGFFKDFEEVFAVGVFLFVAELRIFIKGFDINFDGFKVVFDDFAATIFSGSLVAEIRF